MTFFISSRGLYMRFFSRQSLWHHKDFRKFWLGETISTFGSQVTAFALPITAVLTLQATPIQMGLLSFLAFAPMLFLSLFAGVAVDRFPRRPVLIVTSLGQAIVIGTIPFAALLHLLSFLRLHTKLIFLLLSNKNKRSKGMANWRRATHLLRLRVQGSLVGLSNC
jgi:MFS family permease